MSQDRALENHPHALRILLSSNPPITAITKCSHFSSAMLGGTCPRDVTHRPVNSSLALEIGTAPEPPEFVFFESLL